MPISPFLAFGRPSLPSYALAHNPAGGLAAGAGAQPASVVRPDKSPPQKSGGRQSNGRLAHVLAPRLVGAWFILGSSDFKRKKGRWCGVPCHATPHVEPRGRLWLLVGRLLLGVCISAGVCYAPRATLAQGHTAAVVLLWCSASPEPTARSLLIAKIHTAVCSRGRCDGPRLLLQLLRRKDGGVQFGDLGQDTRVLFVASA